jgi:hypothetical protein
VCDDVEITKRFHITTRLSPRIDVVRCKAASVRYATLPSRPDEAYRERCSLP